MAGGSDGGSGSPFQIGESVELVRVITQLSILVALIMLLEVFVHHGSHKLKAHPKYHEVLTKALTGKLLHHYLLVYIELVYCIIALRADW